MFCLGHFASDILPCGRLNKKKKKKRSVVNCTIKLSEIYWVKISELQSRGLKTVGSTKMGSGHTVLQGQQLKLTQGYGDKVLSRGLTSIRARQIAH